MKNMNLLIACVLLVLAGSVGYRSYFTAASVSAGAVKMSDFPLTIGEWKAEDLPLEEHVYELLETRNLIMREYANTSGDSINLYIIYSRDNRKVSHPPEICLQGEGGVVTEKLSFPISPAITATRLILEKDGIRQAVVYWYKAGADYTNNYLEQQLKVSGSRLVGKKPSLALIRVVTLIQEKKDEEAFNKIRTFCSLLEPFLSQYAP